ASRRRRDAMLAGARLGDDARLAHAPGEERLADRAVDLVRPGVGEVLALEQHAGEPDRAREPGRVGERRRASDPVAQQDRELLLERSVGARLEPGRLELGHRGHERLRQVLTAELAVPAGTRRRDHALTVRLIDAMA